METIQNIHIIECEDAHKGISKIFHLKDEIETITGAMAMAYIPVKGAVSINGFREQDEFKFGLLSLQLNSQGSTYALPVEFAGIQGRIDEEEKNQNFNKQVQFTPIAINREVPGNSNLKVKFSNGLSEFSFKYNIRLYLTYTEK